MNVKLVIIGASGVGKTSLRTKVDYVLRGITLSAEAWTQPCGKFLPPQVNIFLIVLYRCTRWFIPLFLFPVPTTRPYFLVLFLISAVFHARPCPYCIAILIGLFVTTCAWSPIPPSAFEQTSLSALNTTELEATWQMTSIALLSRCWCDFQQTPFFGYYNVTEWEVDSLRQAAEAANITSALNQVPEAETPGNTKSFTSDDSQVRAHHERVRKWIGSLRKRLDELLPGSRSVREGGEMGEKSGAIEESQTTPKGDTSSIQKEHLPWLRWKYDLRPHGIDLIVDLGWRRSD